jgi:hypothetical protein
MAAYFTRYACAECGQTNEVHSYLFYPETDLQGFSLREVMFEDEFLRYREKLRCEVTGNAAGVNIDAFTLVNAPTEN